MNKEIKAEFTLIDDEVAMIICPYCGNDLMIDIYEDCEPCKCGKKFILHQRNWVEEIT